MGSADPSGSPIRLFAHIKVTSKNHSRRGETGTVVRIRGARLWVAFPGGELVPIRSSSIRVITKSPRFREQEQ